MRFIGILLFALTGFLQSTAWADAPASKRVLKELNAEVEATTQPPRKTPSPMTGTMTVGVVGDITPGYKFSDEVAQYIKSADIRVANLVVPPEMTVPDDFAQTLKTAGFNVVTFASDHVRGTSSSGLLSLKKNLDRSKISYSDRTKDRAGFDVGGAKVAVMAGDHHLGIRTVERPEEFIKEIRSIGGAFKILILSVRADTDAAKIATRQFAKTAIDEGADLIVIQGSQDVGALEIYKNRLIAHGLGVFAAQTPPEGDSAFVPLLRAQLNGEGELVRGHITSFVRNADNQLQLDKEHRAFNLMREMTTLGSPDSPMIFSNDGYFIPQRASQ